MKDRYRGLALRLLQKALETCIARKFKAQLTYYLRTMLRVLQRRSKETKEKSQPRHLHRCRGVAAIDLPEIG